MMQTEELKLTQEWDKVFPKSDKVDHKKVTFANHCRAIPPQPQMPMIPILSGSTLS